MKFKLRRYPYSDSEPPFALYPVEVAKILRVRLSRSFPGVGFSVICLYDYGIVIRYEDGPGIEDVEAITENYIGLITDLDMDECDFREVELTHVINKDGETRLVKNPGTLEREGGSIKPQSFCYDDRLIKDYKLVHIMVRRILIERTRLE